MIIEKSGMAWGGMVHEVSPIEGADNIQRASVACGDGGKWSCVVPKATLPGTPLVVFLPDSIVPNMPETAFMEKHGWRVKMMRLRGCPSEVLAVSLPIEFSIGDDLTDRLGVKKYEKEIPSNLAGEFEGPFPSFIRKTDEPNFQSAPELVEALVGQEYYATVKYDGSSQTFFKYRGEIGGCGRNWQLTENANTAVWKIANRYGLPENLKDGLAIQWECIGPGIQGNPCKLLDIDCRVFSVYDIVGREYLGLQETKSVCCELGLPMVDVVYGGMWASPTDDMLRDMARGKYAESGATREGIVIRGVKPLRVGSQFVSFKVINLDYKN